MGGYRLDRKHPRNIPLLGDYARKAEEFSGKTIFYTDPRDKICHGYERCISPLEVVSLVEKAVVAQKIWKNSSFAERNLVLSDLMDVIIANQDDLCRASMMDTGKTLVEARLGEIVTTLEKIRYTINYGQEALKPSYRRVPWALAHKSVRVEYSPLGVIGAIIPWNYPIHSALSIVISAIYAGNAVVVKISEHSPCSRHYIEQLVHEVLKIRGHSPHLVRFIVGHGDVGEALCQAPGISKLLFIGSPEIGKKVMSLCSKNLIPVILELGGKDPFIVLDDCDLRLAAQMAVRGSFVNCGQNCIASERIFVQKSVLNDFIKLVVEIVNSTTQGIGNCDWGCMTTIKQLEKVESLIKDAVTKGANVVVGNRRNAKFQDGLFLEPTILTNVTPAMRIYHEETFGPVMTILEFESEHELLNKVNDCKFGLGASVFSNDIPRAERVLAEIDSGMSVVNDFGTQYMVQDVPFGGCKSSGFGRFNGPEGLREFSNIRTIFSEKFLFSYSFKCPWIVSYPMPAVSEALVKQFTLLFYGWGLWTKCFALLNIIKIILNSSKNAADGKNVTPNVIIPNLPPDTTPSQPV